MKKMLLGNAAIAHGAIDAGVGLVCGYPGTPSTEILQTVAQNNRDKKIYIEWSVNEKAALEVAAGAAFCGTRTLVTMKQVGLNVAADPIMSLAYLGIKGGRFIAVAEDPAPFPPKQSKIPVSLPNLQIFRFWTPPPLPRPMR